MRLDGVSQPSDRLGEGLARARNVDARVSEARAAEDRAVVEPQVGLLDDEPIKFFQLDPQILDQPAAIEPGKVGSFGADQLDSFNRSQFFRQIVEIFRHMRAEGVKPFFAGLVSSAAGCQPQGIRFVVPGRFRLTGERFAQFPVLDNDVGPVEAREVEGF